jgi:3-oxoacyl-[acyl-carrier protein] reductase
VAARLLEGKKVLITAAAGAGIGFATAVRCLEEGAFVVISDMSAKRLAAASDRLHKASHTFAGGVVANVTSEEDVATMFETAIAAMGGLDVLVNNAGITVERDIVNLSDEEWHAVIDVCLTGSFRCLRAALRHMVPNRKGAVVNLSSVLGWRAQGGQAPYSAAKAGVMALTRAAAMEVASAGIRVNAVAPSLALNPFLTKSLTVTSLEKEVQVQALGRGADPTEIANVIVFLASDLASYMTGECISVSSQHA